MTFPNSSAPQSASFGERAPRPFGMLWLGVLLGMLACGDDASVDSGVDGSIRDASGPDAALGQPDVAFSDSGTDGGASSVEWEPQPWEDCEGEGRLLMAGPEDYRDVLRTMAPGDTLSLVDGTYTRGLPISVSGAEGQCIVIQGAPGQRPLFTGSNDFNIVALHGASYVKVRGLDIDGLGMAGFGVASQGGESMPSHHVVIEDLSMVGLSSNQQIVGISTKSTVWDWVIRNNRIDGAGTGLYLGNSDGTSPFIRGVIEFNVVLRTVGYGMQIKHQNERPNSEGLPAANSETIIRWNVFMKDETSSTSADLIRPNLLLGALPSSGPGQNDRYLVYGNLFFNNPGHQLVQMEGNVAFYNNILFNEHQGGLLIRSHHGSPREIDVFFNTVVSAGTGISVNGGDPAFEQRLRYNAVFADTPISASDSLGDITGSRTDAMESFVDAEGGLGALDLHPQDVLSVVVDSDELPERAHRDVDYDGVTGSRAFAGALSQSGGPAITLDVRAR